jgi:hypothetical protein
MFSTKSLNAKEGLCIENFVHSKIRKQFGSVRENLPSRILNYINPSA